MKSSHTGLSDFVGLYRNENRCNCYVVGHQLIKDAQFKDDQTNKVRSIGLPPKDAFHIDVDPTRLAFMNQCVKGTLVSPLQDVDEALEFARCGAPPAFMSNPRDFLELTNVDTAQENFV